MNKTELIAAMAEASGLSNLLVSIDIDYFTGGMQNEKLPV